MTNPLRTVLLLALPASGKSEVRRYLASLPAERVARDFHMGPTVQLDDFPYVHLMRRIDDEAERIGAPRIFFSAPDRSFRDPRDWGTLIELLDEDYSRLGKEAASTTDNHALALFQRIDRAAIDVGIPPRIKPLSDSMRDRIARGIEAEVASLDRDLDATRRQSLDGKTVVIEFARGGKQGASMPLEAPFGYRYSLGRLSREILESASILYVWVTPEESRRKNDARTDPNDPGSILHHGVPEHVMMNDYGIDDMAWLIEQSDRTNTVAVHAHGSTFHLPVARFDNRVDKTSFVRNPEPTWAAEDVKRLHDELASALCRLSSFRCAPDDAPPVGSAPIAGALLSFVFSAGNVMTEPANRLFDPTEEHRLLREMVSSFAKEAIEPTARERDSAGRFDRALFVRMAELGLLGVTIPQESGGAGMDATAAVIVHHELSKIDPGLCLGYLAHAVLFVNNFFHAANDEQRARYLPRALSGQWLGGMGMTEPEHGTDVLGMKTTATRRDDFYLLNGTKTYITNAPDGDLFIVYAKLDGQVTSFVVDRSCPGFSTSAPMEKMGMRSSSMGELVFDDCRVPRANLLGEECAGLTHMMRNLEIERLTLAAMSLGIADRCLELMVRYANERIAFGQPIVQFGQIQRYIGEAYAMTEAARCLIYQVARNVGPNVRNRLGCDAAKLFAAPVGKTVADYAMQVFGGAGYSAEFPIERLYRDAKLLEIGGGTLESHQKNIAKDLSRTMR